MIEKSLINDVAAKVGEKDDSWTHREPVQFFLGSLFFITVRRWEKTSSSTGGTECDLFS